jgi:hypothetical protein
MAPRCPNGTRRNKKIGNCEKKTAKKRCPNGSRRNKKTRECDKYKKLKKILSNKKSSSSTSKKMSKKSSSSPETKRRDASFYDIAEKVTPGYEDRGELTREEGKTLTSRLKTYLRNHTNIKYGDIVFVGSTSDRQEYGFKLVLDDGDTVGGESGAGLPLGRAKELENRDIHYDSLLTEMNNDDESNEIMKMYFFGDNRDAYDEFVQDYKEKNIF